MPLSSSVRRDDSPTTPQPQHSITTHRRPSSSSSRSVTPQHQPPAAAPDDNETMDPVEAEEHASLINEIRRLEKTMNGALRASRDEMESLKETAAEKKAEVKRMEEELENITKKMANNNSNNNNRRQQLQRRTSNSSIGSVSTKGTRRQNRRLATPGASSGAGESNLRNSMILGVNKLHRRVSVAGDRPFFRRPTEQSESIRRVSDSALPPDPKLVQGLAIANTTMRDDSSRQPSRFLGKQLSLRKVDFGVVGDESSDDSDSDSNERINKLFNNSDETDQEIINHQKTLKSKTEQIAQLQKQEESNSNQLSYLQSKLQSLQTKTRSRLVQHASTVEALHSKKQALAKSVERRGRLINDVEGCLDGYEGRIAKLEAEIVNKKNAQYRQHRHDSTSNNNDKSNTVVTQLEEDIQKYQLRLQIHSQYTAKALHSFLRSMDEAKMNDIDGILFKNNNKDHNVEEEEDEVNDFEEGKRQHLIEEIAFDVDIQLNNLERMIKEVDSKVKEYELLSSVELDPAAAASPSLSSPSSSDGAIVSTQHHPSQLLALTIECADLLADFISTISKTIESTTVCTAPHYFSIEFQPSSSPDKSDESKAASNSIISTTNATEKRTTRPNNRLSSTAMTELYQTNLDTIHHSNDNNYNYIIDEQELPYLQNQRKRIHLHDLHRSQLQVNTNISLLQNDMQSFQTAMQEEKRARYEMMSNLQSKLRMLMDRLEVGGEEIHGLVNELDQWKERERVLLNEFHRDC